MSTDVRVLCRPELAAGFRLTGLPVLVASSLAEAQAHLVEARASGRTGLLLVQDDLHAWLRAELDPRSPQGLPVLVPFPTPCWTEDAVDERVVEILRRAIGYQVRLR